MFGMTQFCSCAQQNQGSNRWSEIHQS